LGIRDGEAKRWNERMNLKPFLNSTSASRLVKKKRCALVAVLRRVVISGREMKIATLFAVGTAIALAWGTCLGRESFVHSSVVPSFECCLAE
jgi:hypothetical protein